MPWMQLCCREYAHFNGARDYSRDTRPAAYAVCTLVRLQWSLGLLPGYTYLTNARGLKSLASMEPGIIPGIHPQACISPARRTCFNGARDYSRDTPPCACPLWGLATASMEPGITPGIHQRVLGKQFANLVASMEPGITPGIHLAAKVRTALVVLLQWSPGLLPGYTATSFYQGLTRALTSSPA